MADVLVADANVVIDFFENRREAVEYLTPLRRRNALAIHPVGIMEVLRGAANALELQALDRGLSSLRTLRVKGNDLPACIDLFRRHHLSHKIGWPDCLIAATCLRLDLPLVTLNVKHFKPIRGLRVIRPY